jgi:hypothetical protein
VRSYADELRLEIGKPRIDQFATDKVRLGGASNLDRMGPGGRSVVHQERNVGILEHVPPLLGTAEVNAADIDRVLIGIEPIRQRNQMGIPSEPIVASRPIVLRCRYAISASEKTLIQELLVPVSVLAHPRDPPGRDLHCAAKGAGER